MAFEKRTDISFCLEKVGSQLVCQNVAVTRITRGETFAQCRLALSLYVAVRGIKIIETGIQKCVNHVDRFGNIHVFAIHRQTHTAKSEIFFDVFHIQHSLFSNVSNALITQA